MLAWYRPAEAMKWSLAEYVTRRRSSRALYVLRGSAVIVASVRTLRRSESWDCPNRSNWPRAKPFRAPVESMAENFTSAKRWTRNWGSAEAVPSLAASACSPCSFAASSRGVLETSCGTERRCRIVATGAGWLPARSQSTATSASVVVSASLLSWARAAPVLPRAGQSTTRTRACPTLSPSAAGVVSCAASTAADPCCAAEYGDAPCAPTTAGRSANERTRTARRMVELVRDARRSCRRRRRPRASDSVLMQTIRTHPRHTKMGASARVSGGRALRGLVQAGAISPDLRYPPLP